MSVADRLRSRSTVVLPTHRSWVIRDAALADLPATARLHIRELPVGLFPRLGPRFVARWHRAFVQSPDAVALVAIATHLAGGERVAGFLVGATDRSAFHHELLTRHRTTLLVHGALALAAHPRTLLYFLRTRLRPYLRRLRTSRPPEHRAAGTGQPTTGGGAVADLTAIAVAPALRRSGVGRELVEKFLERCATAGTQRIELVTAAGSTEAMRFYARTGWTRLRQDVTRDGLQVQRFGRWTNRADGV